VLTLERLVILGDPGAGKTTFLRWVVFNSCESLLEGQSNATDDSSEDTPTLFPLFVRVRDLAEYIATQRRRDSGPASAESPGWLVEYLAVQSAEIGADLSPEFFKQLLEEGAAVLLLDGLDEAPTDAERESVGRLIHNLSLAFGRCRFVVTSRPMAFRGRIMLPDFAQIRIDFLLLPQIERFLDCWTRALFPDSERLAREHSSEFLLALSTNSELRRLATNPVMLTALVSVFWNAGQVPQLRSELYESIIAWFSRSRPGREDPRTANRYVRLLQALALAMQNHPDGRHIQVSKHWAGERLADGLRDIPEDERVDEAECFLRDEESHSGLVVVREDQLRFWHLTFQEYLAAKAIASGSEGTQDAVLLGHEEKLLDDGWRQVILLLADILRRQGIEKLDGMISKILDLVDDSTGLERRMHFVGLLGQIVGDAESVGYRPQDPRYGQLLDEMVAIFSRGSDDKTPIESAIAAAESLGRAGDPRFRDPEHTSHWITLESGGFTMGAQNDDPAAANYDSFAADNELPVHEVVVASFRMRKYPVTVTEYQRFIDRGGYENSGFWTHGGFGEWEEPEEWSDQLSHPNRPVVGISWFEACAYAEMYACRLPTEEEWEFAARGTKGRQFPWGNEAASERHLNCGIDEGHGLFASPRVGGATPVGVYPLGATPEGICDLAGNVGEWCADVYARYLDPSTGDSARVVRGGGWVYGASLCRASARNAVEPGSRDHLVGFRIVQDAGAEPD